MINCKSGACIVLLLACIPLKALPSPGLQAPKRSIRVASVYAGIPPEAALGVTVDVSLDAVDWCLRRLESDISRELTRAACDCIRQASRLLYNLDDPVAWQSGPAALFGVAEAILDEDSVAARVQDRQFREYLISQARAARDGLADVDDMGGALDRRRLRRGQEYLESIGDSRIRRVYTALIYVWSSSSEASILTHVAGAAEAGSLTKAMFAMRDWDRRASVVLGSGGVERSTDADRWRSMFAPMDFRYASMRSAIAGQVRPSNMEAALRHIVECREVQGPVPVVAEDGENVEPRFGLRQRLAHALRLYIVEPQDSVEALPGPKYVDPRRLGVAAMLAMRSPTSVVDDPTTAPLVRARGSGGAAGPVGIEIVPGVYDELLSIAQDGMILARDIDATSGGTRLPLLGAETEFLKLVAFLADVVTSAGRAKEWAYVRDRQAAWRLREGAARYWGDVRITRLAESQIGGELWLTRGLAEAVTLRLDRPPGEWRSFPGGRLRPLVREGVDGDWVWPGR